MGDFLLPYSAQGLPCSWAQGLWKITNKQSKRASWPISYQIKTIKAVQRYVCLNINTVSRIRSPSAWTRLAQSKTIFTFLNCSFKYLSVNLSLFMNFVSVMYFTLYSYLIISSKLVFITISFSVFLTTIIAVG